MTTPSQGEQQLFRDKAMQSVGGRNRLNTLSPVVSARLWVFAASLGFLVASVAVWGFFGRVPVTVDGTGVFVRGERIVALVAPFEGRVTELLHKPGDRVKAGDLIARMESQEAEGVPLQQGSVIASEAGELTAVSVVVGDSVRDAQYMFALVVGDAKLRSVAFLPLGDAKVIEPGFPALLHFATRIAGSNGDGRGTVTHVESFMTPSERVFQRVPNPEFVRMIQERFGTASEVLIEVDERSLSNPVTTGMPCDIEIVVDHVRPVELVFPGLRAHPNP